MAEAVLDGPEQGTGSEAGAVAPQSPKAPDQEPAKPTPLVLGACLGLAQQMLKVSKKLNWKSPADVIPIPGLTEELWLNTVADSGAIVLVKRFPSLNIEESSPEKTLLVCVFPWLLINVSTMVMNRFWPMPAELKKEEQPDAEGTGKDARATA